MRRPKMTTRRWMIVVAVAAVDFALIVQRASDPLSYFALYVAIANIILLPAMLLLFVIASPD
jgi:hypothetical protein